MTYQHLQWTVESGVAEITLHRPEVLNSFNELMGREFQEALRAAADPSIRAVLLTGAGRGFCAGQDLAETQGTPETGPVDFAEIVRKKYTPIVLGIRQLEEPVICAVNGVAAGAGASLAFCCDFVLASESASFIQAFAKIGLVPDTGGTFFLPRIGMEVLVSFLGGNPDRPLVTGCVYNGANHPPYPLPDEKTKSTIISTLAVVTAILAVTTRALLGHGA